MSYIQLQNISLVYQATDSRIDVFDNTTVEFEAGEYALVLGRSGTGKSSLLNLVAGLVAPTKGRVVVGGEDIAHFDKNQMARYRSETIGYVFQNFNLVDSFTALENVMVPLLIAGKKRSVAKREAMHLLNRVGLEERHAHFPRHMSGGEQQRVAIARALANDPAILLADEPTGNLDAKTSDTILALLDDIHSKGKTVILVSHDETITQRATRVLRMEEFAS